MFYQNISQGTKSCLFRFVDRGQFVQVVFVAVNNHWPECCFTQMFVLYSACGKKGEGGIWLF